MASGAAARRQPDQGQAKVYTQPRQSYVRPVRHIITLSSIPPRFSGIGQTLAGLLQQSSRPEAVELYIPRTYRRFPQWGGGLPQVPDGVRIVRVDEDLGPATKILPAARAYRGQAVELLYVDDDYLFSRDWAQVSLAMRKAHPRAAICSAAGSLQANGRNWVADGPLPRAIPAPGRRLQAGFVLRRFLRRRFGLGADKTGVRPASQRLVRSGYADIAKGFGGVMVQPDCFDDLAYDIPQVLWSVDDVWLSGHLARRGIAIWADRRLNKSIELAPLSAAHPLYRLVVDGADRLAANRACIDHMRKTYGIWGGAAGTGD
jgi:hypothetical protein